MKKPAKVVTKIEKVVENVEVIPSDYEHYKVMCSEYLSQIST